ncbi:T-lymphocyte activation antigen CD86 isoform X2 [Dicentrarchus labrax]|uniref:T-lymphocyte activation antigen CD86 isoform X2 n=1 Tax=Dicentrarchus labrax TaxID=13489 RepID=UPI0021F5A01B|nr:T-lymphocyte activation antigen CD86 isoform X2 [Dicentrarchus labrax]
MKASLYNPQHFVFSLRNSLLLALVTITWHISVTECVDLHLSGEVGGNVTIRCPFDKDRKILFFYFQKGDAFVNGYYEDRHMDHKKVPKWNNTRFDRANNTVYMYNLTVAHSGEYQCHIKYSGGDLKGKKIQLTVTANYSKPEVKQYCSNENQIFGCRVMCASHAGYPDKDIVWNVHGAQIWNVVNTSKTTDPHTMMFSVYSLAYYNCSNGPLEALSCSVGAVTSEMFSLCTQLKDPSEGGWPYMKEVAAILAVAFLMVTLLVWWKCRKRQRGAAAAAAAAAPGDVRERVALNATQGEDGASC